MTSESMPESKTLLPSNPEGLHTPREHVRSEVVGPGVLASPMRQSDPQNKLKNMKIQIKNLGARKLHFWFTTRDLQWLPSFHSNRVFFDKMVSSLVI
jgi:hypothetical protein